MATDHSPRSLTAVTNSGVDIPHSGRRSLPSAWASVVRGDSEQISSPTAAATPGVSSPPPETDSASDTSVVETWVTEAHPESSDVIGEGNAGPPRRPAWNRPVNGVVEAVSVMGGAVSWPALSESTRPVPRSSSDSPRPVSDGPVSSSQAPIISPPLRRQSNSNTYTNSTANNTTPSRPRSRNRGGGGGGSSSVSGSSQNNFSRPSPPAPPPFPILEVHRQPFHPVFDVPVRNVRSVGGSQSHTGNDHSSQRTNSRRSNFGARPRVDGPHHINHGVRRDHDRRDVHFSPQYVPPPLGYMPPTLAPGAPPFIVPQPIRMFPNQMGFDMMSSYIYVPPMHPETFRPMPMVPPAQPPMPMNPLSNLIVSQIDYYFSEANLVKDNFLRSNMDDQGWVPITLIASFPRVQQLTHDIPLILESMRYSAVVEVQGDKVRKHYEWNRWLNSSGRPNLDTGSHNMDATPENSLATSFREVSLNEASTSANGDINKREGHTEMVNGRFFSEELTDQSRLANGDDTVEEPHSIIV
ncbi:la-related protein 1C-like [Primulina tabacum]|uniref:la-related protein 1C-like n=1 Tax=Primulina tabacum TaxID=48773 RepID=UPI003F5A7814